MIRRIKLKDLYTTSCDESWWDDGDETPAEIYEMAINKFEWVDTAKGMIRNLTGEEPVLVDVCSEVANELKQENKLVDKADEQIEGWIGVIRGKRDESTQEVTPEQRTRTGLPAKEHMPDKWTRTVDDMPPDGLVVEVKNEAYKEDKQCYLLREHGHWYYGYSRSYLNPTHWRRNERRLSAERRDSNNRRIRDRRHEQ